jgi:3-phenylpropionate/trans-cinnamate dioxygenase ferredoxin component
MSDWIDVGDAAALGVSQRLPVEVDGRPIVVVRCADGLHAIEDRCTHDGEPLASGDVEDCEIICPRHFARFSLKTGEALTPPAYEPVRTYRVREENGRLLVERPV